MQNLFNECLIPDNFPDNLKLADITAVIKKEDLFNKENYKPVYALPSVSKIFRKLMQKQINVYIDNFYHLTYATLAEVLARSNH